MVTPTSSRLTTAAARIRGKFPAVQDFGTRRLRIEPSVQTPLMELSLLPIGDASPSARKWARLDRASPPSSQDQLLHEGFDRLSRSLMDFSRLMEVFDRQNVTSVSVTGHSHRRSSLGAEGRIDGQRLARG